MWGFKLRLWIKKSFLYQHKFHRYFKRLLSTCGIVSNDEDGNPMVNYLYFRINSFKVNRTSNYGRETEVWMRFRSHSLPHLFSLVPVALPDAIYFNRAGRCAFFIVSRTWRYLSYDLCYWKDISVWFWAKSVKMKYNNNVLYLWYQSQYHSMPFMWNKRNF